MTSNCLYYTPHSASVFVRCPDQDASQPWHSFSAFLSPTPITPHMSTWDSTSQSAHGQYRPIAKWIHTHFTYLSPLHFTTHTHTHTPYMVASRSHDIILYGRSCARLKMQSNNPRGYCTPMSANVVVNLRLAAIGFCLHYVSKCVWILVSWSCRANVSLALGNVVRTRSLVHCSHAHLRSVMRSVDYAHQYEKRTTPYYIV